MRDPLVGLEKRLGASGVRVLQGSQQRWEGELAKKPSCGGEARRACGGGCSVGLGARPACRSSETGAGRVEQVSARGQSRVVSRPSRGDFCSGTPAPEQANSSSVCLR